MTQLLVQMLDDDEDKYVLERLFTDVDNFNAAIGIIFFADGRQCISINLICDDAIFKAREARKIAEHLLSLCDVISDKGATHEDPARTAESLATPEKGSVPSQGPTPHR